MSPTRKAPRKDRKEDVLFMLWQCLGALESRIRKPREEVLDAEIVRCSYNLLNDIGYTTARPQWEKKP